MSSQGLEPLATWLAGQGVKLARPIQLGLLNGGRSNLTYQLVASDGQRIVIRRPPEGKVPATAHDMAREWTFISALSGSRVPVPRPLAYCDDGHLLGAPFFAMEFVQGVVLADHASARALNPASRHRAGLGMIDTLVDLHSTDADRVGLQGMGLGNDYIARQLHRWHERWQRSKVSNISGMDELHNRLAITAPPQRETTIVHGDFRLGNIIVDSTGHVEAVLDWELATLGDPLSDLAWTVMWWNAPIETEDSGPPSVLDGFPTSDDLVERYAAQRGTHVSDLPYYVAFNMWRTLCIWAGSTARQRTTVAGGETPRFRIGRWCSQTEMVEEALTMVADR